MKSTQLRTDPIDALQALQNRMSPPKKNGPEEPSIRQGLTMRGGKLSASISTACNTLSSRAVARACPTLCSAPSFSSACFSMANSGLLGSNGRWMAEQPASYTATATSASCWALDSGLNASPE